VPGGDEQMLGEQGAGGFMSPRALMVGSLLVGLCGVAGPYLTLYLQSSRMFADYHTGGASFCLFALLILFNFGVGLLLPWLRFRASELMAMGAMMLTGGAIVTSGLVAYFIPAISSVYYRANASNQWKELLWDELPDWLSPLDPNGAAIGIKNFWEGVPAGEPIPWGIWVGPLAKWGIFLMALFAVMVAIMVIMRKQWVDYEHLSFPIAQVPAELCLAAESGRANNILTSKTFWIGLGTTFALASSGALGTYIGTFPFFRLREWIEFAPGPWRLPIYLDLVVMGLVFLIPNRVAFTVWFVALVSWFIRSFLQAYNLALPNAEMYSGEMNHVAMGATAVFVFASLWLSREHLKRAVKCAFWKGERDYDAGEPSSYRTAFIVVFVGMIVTVVWLHVAGLPWYYGIFLILVTLAVYYAMARVVAQCGLPAVSPPIYPHMFVASLFGSAYLPNRSLAVMGMHYGWHFDMRNSAMSGSAHGMYLAERRRSGLFWVLLWSLLIAYVTAAVTAVWVSYRHGGLNMDGWFFGNFPRIPWVWAQYAINQPEGPDVARMFWAGGGAVLMTLLIWAQRTLFWWPLHPVGLLICSSHMVYFFWASVFAAWLIKVLVIAVGGYTAFRIGRRVFIGMVMGYFVAGGFWAIIDVLTQTTGDAVFYI